MKAFPITSEQYLSGKLDEVGGMDLRDYFAAKAMQGIMSQSHQNMQSDDWCNSGWGWGEDTCNDLNKKRKVMVKTIADFSYQIADAMMEARNDKS